MNTTDEVISAQEHDRLTALYGPLTDAIRCWSEFTLGAPYEGPPGLVHGGVCALVLDHILGEAASERLTKPLFTGTISVKYLRGTALGRLRTEAEGIFVRPAWARAAG